MLQSSNVGGVTKFALSLSLATKPSPPSVFIAWSMREKGHTRSSAQMMSQVLDTKAFTEKLEQVLPLLEPTWVWGRTTEGQFQCKCCEFKSDFLFRFSLWIFYTCQVYVWHAWCSPLALVSSCGWYKAQDWSSYIGQHKIMTSVLWITWYKTLGLPPLFLHTASS